MLKISNLCKSFQGIKALDYVNLEIDDLVITGLAGQSGSGKSTLLRCIQGLEKQDSGEIVCNKRRTFMFQDFQLFPHMTVLRNLMYAPSLNGNKNNLLQKAIMLLDRLNLKEKLNSYPHQLSGGQKQRVALCRSLMMNPELLLCDEPTSGLDIATIEEVVSLLKSVSELGVGIIITSHDLDFLTKIATRIIVLKQGKVATEIATNTQNSINYLKEFY